jgi:hypothetical protein
MRRSVCCVSACGAFWRRTSPAKTLQLLSRGVGQLARLMRAKRAVSGEAADGLADAFAKALDELSTEMGIEL